MYGIISVNNDVIDSKLIIWICQIQLSIKTQQSVNSCFNKSNQSFNLFAKLTNYHLRISHVELLKPFTTQMHV